MADETGVDLSVMSHILPLSAWLDHRSHNRLTLRDDKPACQHLVSRYETQRHEGQLHEYPTGFR